MQQENDEIYLEKSEDSDCTKQKFIGDSLWIG